MTADVDIVNRALQALGTRTDITSLAQNTNEAIQANLVFASSRDEVLRMAPWNAATAYLNAVYITSAPGTPENPTLVSSQWAPGQPAPPWVYEYQYPADCLRPLFIIPQWDTGFVGSIPLFPVVTGGAPQTWNGPPVRFKVATDTFVPVTAAAVVNGGAGYAVGDLITLQGTPSGSAPIGAPAVLQVDTAPGGVIATVEVVNQILNRTPVVGGSYFAQQTNPVAQGSTTGSGSGATFNLTYGAKLQQRVILTNQEFAILCYLKQITDPNLMDPLLIKAWAYKLAADLAIQLTGDVQTANLQINRANEIIVQARTADGNEGLTINDVTPDWIRARGIEYPYTFWSANQQFDWGPLFTPY